MSDNAKNAYDSLVEKKISSQEIYNGVVVHLYRDEVELPNKNTSVREVLRDCRAVCVLPLDREGNVTVVRQFRYAHDKVLTEIPAGKLDAGEEFLEAAKRELWEETGIVGGNFRFLGEIYTTPAFVDEVIYMYLVTDFDEEGSQHLDRDEFLNVEKIPLDTLVKMTLDGEIRDAKTQTAVLKVAALRDRGEI